MLKILCTGDFQLDKTFGTLGKSAKLFRQQLMDTFESVILEHGAKHDLILIAGDLFDREATPTSVIEEVSRTLSKSSTPCVIIPGNHDFVRSGIPYVLEESLKNVGAKNTHVMTEKKPISFSELGLTIYPAPLYRKDDISDLWGWIPEREQSDGIRIALMHGALESLPGGTIPENLANAKDLDAVVCGDQHGPSRGDDSASELFNIDKSKSRKLYYSMAPEAQHINQNFVGSYLSLSFDEEGEITNHERIEVGNIRFFNESIDFENGEESDESIQMVKAFFSQLDDCKPELTSIRLNLGGQLSSGNFSDLQNFLKEITPQWPLLKLDRHIIVSDDSEVSIENDPAIDCIKRSLESGKEVSEEMNARIMEIVRLNIGRWK